MRQSRSALRQAVFLRAVGAAIRFRREQLNLTIVQVAGRLGTSSAAVARLERGARNLTLLQLEAIAGALEVPLATLLSFAERRAGDRRRSRHEG
ncbi:MAG TPA: helix-turn-helix transcriptional regulator [Steroidobacteraceae bacterium]|jgi:transcriptional regulator with XRE-family HTH domain|nr:helix-turn-helix transcriptional regulator [Steroidobacteraceae bacterium]